MQLHDIISSENSAVYHALRIFSSAILKNEIWRPIEDVSFVFLCGANIRLGTPSKRRQLLLKFSTHNLPHTKFFLAESIFKVLADEGHKTNFLDIENDLLNFADFVIIILESESAFCELGAFASHIDLRKKLIIINDYNLRNETSFINFGPVKAVSEISEGKHILYYKMDKDGKVHGDSIGDVFFNLHKLLHKEPKTRRDRVFECDPNIFFTKNSLRFIHDLVFFSAPITFPELSKVIKILFPKYKENQILKHLGLLCAINQIDKTNNGLYFSLVDKPFYEYSSYDIYNLIASFKNLYLRYDNNRFNAIN